MVVWVFVFCGCLLLSKFWLVGAFVYSMCLMVPGFLIYVSWVFDCFTCGFSVECRCLWFVGVALRWVL